MNQAQSRRLRTRCLLLLLPLLVASTPAVSMATTSTTTNLELTGLLSPLLAGIPLTVTVTARNASGVDTAYAGTIHFSSTAPLARLPADYTFNPAVDQGTKTFVILFESLGQWEVLVQDINIPAITGQVPNVSVTPGPAVGFKLILDSPVVAGRPYTFQLIPVDGAGNKTGYTSGPLHFSTDALLVKLPADFTDPIDPLQPPPQIPIYFYKADPATKTLTVSDGKGLTGSTTFVVQPGPFDHVELSWPPPNPAPACGDATVVMTAEDAVGNPVSQILVDQTVTLCATGLSVSFVNATPLPSGRSGNCITGPLVSSWQTTWRDSAEEDVTFTVSGATVVQPMPFTVHWKSGIPSPEKSSFAFSGFPTDTSSIPLLPVHTGLLTAEFTLRDLCGQPATLPAGKVVSFAADPALALTPVVEDRPGRWTASVSLPACPADPKSLAVWPLIDNEVLRKPNGEQVQRLVQPQCSLVRLSLLSPVDSLVAEPGAMVEFALQVSNDSDQPVTGGVLMLEANGLTVAGVGIDGQALPPKGAGFELPELSKGSQLKVNVTAQATTQLNQTPNAKAWIATSDGFELTEKQSVEFQQKAPRVDVGCGSSAAGLPGQLVTWLVLLLVASRPWEGLRRLRRGERNGH